MAETINTNVFDSTKKFVDFSGLDYFWTKAKNYIDGVDTAMSAKVTTIEGDVAKLKTTVGDENSGLIKKVNSIQSDLDGLSGGAGSISTQIANAIGALDVPDAAVVGQYVSSVSEADGKISVTRAALPDYTEVYDAKGAAASALVDAKAYTDSKVDGKFDAAGTAAGLNNAMDARVTALEAIDHEKLASDASADAVAKVLDGAPESFDTLKEVAAWIADNSHASTVAELVTDVNNLKNIDHNAYVAADEATLASAKSYADGLAVNYDAKGSAATALADAKTYVDDKVDGKFDAIGSAATAKTEAIAQAKLDAAEALTNYYKKSETYSKAEVDNLLSTNSSGDRAYAKQYTDELFGSIKFASNSDIDGLFTVA